MSVTVLIWNIFIWSFTGLMIYLNNASLWWIVLPAFMTMTKDSV